MANIRSKEKRNRQNEKRRIKNSQIKSSIRTAAKNTISAIEAKEGPDKEVAEKYLHEFIKKIDIAMRKGVVHRNTAARKKSRLVKRVNSISA